MTSIITNTDLKEEHQYIAIQLIHIITKYDASWIKTNDDIVSSNRERKPFEAMSLLFELVSIKEGSSLSKLHYTSLIVVTLRCVNVRLLPLLLNRGIISVKSGILWTAIVNLYYNKVIS